MTALKQLRFELRDCEVGDYGFHLRGRMDDWFCVREIPVMPAMPAFCSMSEGDVSTLPGITVRVFECGWTIAGIKIWVRVT